MSPGVSSHLVESLVIIIPKDHEPVLDLSEEWLLSYYLALQDLNFCSSSWLTPSVHVLIPVSQPQVMTLCRITYYVLMWIFRQHNRRAVHLACAPYKTSENDIRQLTPDQFLYTCPSGWSALWADSFHLTFVTLRVVPRMSEGPQATQSAETLKLLGAIHSLALTVQKAYDVPLPNPTMVCFGGTFDGLHPGHMSTLNDLIQVATQTSSNKLIAIAVSDDEAVRVKDHTDLSLPFKFRRQQVMKCLSFLLHLMAFRKVLEVRSDKKQLSLNLAVPPRIKTALRIITFGWDTIIGLFERDSTVLTIAITDLDKEGVGLAADVGDLEAAFLTPETLKGGEKVNLAREARGLPKLHLIVVPLMWPVDQLLSQHTQMEEKISSRYHRAKFQHYWLYDEQHPDEKFSPESLQAIQRRDSFTRLCRDMGLSEIQKRILLRCIVFPVHMYASSQPKHDDWKVPAHSSICSSQGDIESADYPDPAAGVLAIRSADDFVALFLEDDHHDDAQAKAVESHSLTATAESLNEVQLSKGVCLLECIKGNE